MLAFLLLRKFPTKSPSHRLLNNLLKAFAFESVVVNLDRTTIAPMQVYFAREVFLNPAILSHNIERNFLA